MSSEPDIGTCGACWHWGVSEGPDVVRGTLEEAEFVLAQAAKSLSWRYVPGFRER